MRLRIFVLLSCLCGLIAGCNLQEKKNTESKNIVDPGQSNLATPSSYLGNVPVYDTFTAIEPLFRQRNDTTYVINFWATWCKPCLEELPYLEAFSARHSEDKVKVILVSLDFPNQLNIRLLPFLEKKKLQSKVVVLLDGKYNDWIDKVSPDWTGAIPATYIYKGEREYLIGGPIKDLEDLSDKTKPFMN